MGTLAEVDPPIAKVLADEKARQQQGLELIASISPSNDKTPTLGSHRSLFQELFGNIGAVGQQGEHAPTTDNPNGS